MATVDTKPAAEREAVELAFLRLADTWQNAVAHISSSTKRDNHPAYQAIIALGPAVVPFLLHDLQINQRHWFTALSSITGADPIPEQHAGQILAMVDDWLKWGKEKGYRW